MINKILKIIILFTLYPISIVFPRNRALWVFGSPNGFEGNSKYFYWWMKSKHSSVRSIWIARTDTELLTATRQGVEVYKRFSLLGLWFSLRAKVYIYTAYVSDINYYTSGSAFKVNLWHGVGIKNIEYAIQKGPLQKKYNDGRLSLSSFLEPQVFSTPNLLLVTSDLLLSHFSKCFKLPKEKCVSAMYPRLFMYHSLEMMSIVKKNFNTNKELEGQLENNRVIFYMPTFRDDGKNVLGNAFGRLEVLENVLESTNSILFIKLHPNDGHSGKIYGERIIEWPRELDLYPYLNRIDCLITDYSSILYDYLIAGGKNVIIYDFDYTSYIENSRDLAFSFDDNICGKRVKNFEELCHLLSLNELYSDLETISNDVKIKQLKNRFWGSNTVSIDTIYQRIWENLHD